VKQVIETDEKKKQNTIKVRNEMPNFREAVHLNRKRSCPNLASDKQGKFQIYDREYTKHWAALGGLKTPTTASTKNQNNSDAANQFCTPPEFYPFKELAQDIDDSHTQLMRNICSSLKFETEYLPRLV